MPGTTPGGLPYPLPTDPIADGADAIRDLAEAIEARASYVEADGYTPSLVGVTLGTGGSVSGRYVWVGGPAVGDDGLLSLEMRFTLGTSGAVTATIGFGMPAQFQTAAFGSSNQFYASTCAMNPTGAGVAHFGSLRYSGTQQLVAMVVNASATYATWATAGAGIPAAWGATGFFFGQAIIPAVRI